ncbi:MAG: acyl-CoA dehydrogenase family protein, partial [Pseudomonadota bacterium]
MSLANELDDAELAAIRAGVRGVCEGFSAAYWRDKDRERAYPTEFVVALTDAGYLAALIPEAYGGSGLSLRAAAVIMEEMQAAGCNGSACH